MLQSMGSQIVEYDLVTKPPPPYSACQSFWNLASRELPVKSSPIAVSHLC